MDIASSPGPSHILSRSRGEKSGEGLGSKLHARHNRKWWTRLVCMWTQFRNDGNMPTHNVDSSIRLRRFCQQPWTSQVPSH